MLAKFDIDYTIFPQHNKRVESRRTDDPVEAEDFLMHLLASGARILAIKHEGIELGKFDGLNLDTGQSALTTGHLELPH